MPDEIATAPYSHVMKLFIGKLVEKVVEAQP